MGIAAVEEPLSEELAEAMPVRGLENARARAAGLDVKLKGMQCQRCKAVRSGWAGESSVKMVSEMACQTTFSRIPSLQKSAPLLGMTQAKLHGSMFDASALGLSPAQASQAPTSVQGRVPATAEGATAAHGPDALL